MTPAPGGAAPLTARIKYAGAADRRGCGTGASGV